MIKYCGKCQNDKPLSDFNKHKGRSDGLQPYCRHCDREYMGTYRVTSKEQIAATKKIYREANREKITETAHRYFQTDNGKRRRKIYQDRHRRKYPEKVSSRSTVNQAVSDGKIIKGSACEYCGSLSSIEAHHPSYAKDMRLCVTWLCVPCHKLTHRDHDLWQEKDRRLGL